MGSVRLLAVVALIGVATGTTNATWQELDTFDRPDSTTAGSDWTLRSGSMGVNTGRLVNPGASDGVVTHNSFPSPIDPQEIRFDVIHSQTTAVQYAAAILGYNPANGNHLAVRVQSNGSPFIVYHRVYFYLFNGATGTYQVWPGITDAPQDHPEYDTIHNAQYFPTGQLSALFDPAQGRVTLTIGANDVYTRGGIDPAALGLGSIVGLGLKGPSAIDNLRGNVIPEPAMPVLTAVAGLLLLQRRKWR